MDAEQLAELLAEVRDGTLGADEALARLRRLPYADIAGARIDHHRTLRTGHPEAVYGPGKSPSQCARIVAEMLNGGSGPVLLTRADPDQVAAALEACPDGTVHWAADRHAELPQPTPGHTSRPASLFDRSSPPLATVVWRAASKRWEKVVVASAGTADGPVADEAAAVLSAFGLTANRICDIGLAGLHRFLAEVDTIAGADAVIVVAGMEGALATAVAGVTPAPVVAVPTSVGYGAALNGVTALLAMHASCAAGITVVGIDNGFGAAMATMRVLDLASEASLWSFSLEDVTELREAAENLATVITTVRDAISNDDSVEQGHLAALAEQLEEATRQSWQITERIGTRQRNG